MGNGLSEGGWGGGGGGEWGRRGIGSNNKGCKHLPLLLRRALFDPLGRLLRSLSVNPSVLLLLSEIPFAAAL